jgi:choline dehydrogenase-like flavoprotein
MDLLTEERRQALQAFCDTIVPSIERPDDPDGFWGRKASDLAIHDAVGQALTELPAEQRDGMFQLVDALADQGITRVSARSREQIITSLTLMGKPTAIGVGSLVNLVLFLYYGAPDPTTGQNPNWATFGYPGPVSPPPQVDKPIETIVPDADEVTLDADVCIVGSGPGGSVIAERLTAAGLDVLVLEAGGYYNESDFEQLELLAYQKMWWRGGPTPSADFNISLQAGTALGGGSVINWTNCLRTTPWVREEWANEHGLVGVDGPAFDQHLDAVLERLGATDAASDLSPAQRKWLDAAEDLGWSTRTVSRNTDPDRYSPDTAGYLGFGDQTGSKRSTDKTFLKDAFDRGARFLTRCRVERITARDGRADGVEGMWTDPETGRSARVTVRAPQVVVACGALESPGLLRRSGIGGPAVGDHLRLHPCTLVMGFYDDETRAWWGAPHAGLVDEFAAVEDGHGFLVEGAQYAMGLFGAAIPFSDPRQHREIMAATRTGSFTIGLLRDHGHGRVDVDAAGNTLPSYSITDPLDVRLTHRAIETQVRLHAAAGARRIMALANGTPAWRPGDDLEAFIAGIQRIPLRFGGWRLFSAHQMGSCRMGTDPNTSVAGPFGELYDTKGVWIGDGSAFPTSSGTNPMISIMALARRNAEAIVDVATTRARAAAR